MAKVVLKNIGALISGNILRPLIEADSLIIEDGRIKEIGWNLEKKKEGRPGAPTLIRNVRHLKAADLQKQIFHGQMSSGPGPYA